MMSAFDIENWLNSNWTDFNGTHLWVNNNTDGSSSNQTTDGPGGEDISPPPDLIFRILETFIEYRISQYIGVYGYPFVIVLGTIGNMLSFMVMIRKSMLALSTCFYMAVLAVADTAVLYFSCLRRWITYLGHSETSNVSSAGCKTLNFITYWCFQYSSWVLVAMTIDRFIAIHFPLKAVSFRGLRQPKIIVVAIAVFCAAFNLQYFFIIDLDEEGQCQPLEEHKDFHQDVWPWMDAAIYSFVPFLILSVFNVIIIVDNHKAQKRHSSLHAAGSEYGITAGQLRQETSNKITAMLLAVSISFLVMSAPKVILLIIRDDIFQFFGEDGSINWQHLATYRLVAAISNIFMYLNHSINFLLYCVSGQRFRRELKCVCSFSTPKYELQKSRQSVASTCTSLSDLGNRNSVQRYSSDTSVSDVSDNKLDPNYL